MQRRDQRNLGLDEYFCIEEASPDRHEYYRGAVFAMTGASVEHNRITGNLVAALKRRLSEGPCDVFASDLRLRTPSGLYTYPDVMVICGEIERTADRMHTVTSPVLVVEVLSRTTEVYDREEKFLHYVGIPSLREYLLVDQTRPGIEVFRPDASGVWISSIASGLESAVRLESIGESIPMDEIYARVAWGTLPGAS